MISAYNRGNVVVRILGVYGVYLSRLTGEGSKTVLQQTREGCAARKVAAAAAAAVGPVELQLPRAVACRGGGGRCNLGTVTRRHRAPPQFRPRSARVIMCQCCNRLVLSSSTCSFASDGFFLATHK